MNIIKLFSERVNTFIALLSLIVALTVGVLQFRPRTRELTCSVASSTELTSISQVPGLTSDFTYQQQKVTHLWKITLSYVNSGNETLVGEGQHSTLLKDSVLFSFPEDTEVLNFEVLNADLPVNVEHGPPNSFRIKFSQWRPGEKINLSVYVTSPNSQRSPLIPTIATRDIVGGSVLITNPLNQISQPKSLLDRLPAWFSVIVKLTVSLFCLVVAFIALYLFPKDVVQYLRRVIWKRWNSAKIQSFINGREDLQPAEKSKYVNQPELIPDELWQGFHGRRIILGLVFVLLGTTVMTYVFSNLFDVYLKAAEYLRAP